MTDFSGWVLVAVLSPLIVAAVAAYVLLTHRPLSAEERRSQDAATRRIYREPEGSEPGRR